MTGICPTGGGEAADPSSLEALAAELSEADLEAVILRCGLLAVGNPYRPTGNQRGREVDEPRDDPDGDIP